jgi:four helix bundle suffix protein
MVQAARSGKQNIAEFLKEGGFTERLYHARARARDWRTRK